MFDFTSLMLRNTDLNFNKSVSWGGIIICIEFEINDKSLILKKMIIIIIYFDKNCVYFVRLSPVYLNRTTILYYTYALYYVLWCYCRVRFFVLVCLVKPT